jgi:AP2-associated kinase
MTVKDSMITCGSSAYHAECESMARDDIPPPNAQGATRLRDPVPVKSVDAEIPLISDNEGEEYESLDNTDVFAMAPFPKAKKKCSDNDSDLFGSVPFKSINTNPFEQADFTDSVYFQKEDLIEAPFRSEPKEAILVDLDPQEPIYMKIIPKSVAQVATNKVISTITTNSGFSNMSFEDYSSSDAEECQAPVYSPFEVVRPECDIKRSSLKRRSNPFT